MTSTAATTTTPTVSVPFEPVKEIRLAVVIYGGVSLAIYINGIVQEMLRFVRATAPNDKNSAAFLGPNDLLGSEKVYRKLGQILNDRDGLTPTAALATLTDARPIQTRFIIDILSGTSAGGINAVFLGKALTNNQKPDALARLWIDEADIEKLLNDKLSIKGETALTAQKPPQSLLNSNRMYLKLLNALDGMEGTRKAGEPAALVSELDLFSTATDIRGLTLPITLADKVVQERRHKNFFHFEYQVEAFVNKMDFGSDSNPFLAFAARATSAFPVAFEPMQLSDIFSIVAAQKLHETAPYCDPDTDHWSRFYRDYLPTGPGARTQPFHFRAFGDGGYLDNKPFSYAIDTTLARHSDFPVERKLVYIEPNPEQLGAQPTGAMRPDAVENSLSALLVLPRYETIREDLERVVNRNLQIERLARVTEYVLRERNGRWKTLWTVPQWQQSTSASWYTAPVAAYGPGYAIYERLKLSSVTEELADLLSQIYGVDPRGAFGKAVQVLAGEWRDMVYEDIKEQRDFLLGFDVDYRLRRIRYVRRRITDEYGKPTIPASLSAAESDTYRKDYRKALQEIKAAMREPYTKLRQLLINPTTRDASSKLSIDGQPLPDEIFTEQKMLLVAQPPSEAPDNSAAFLDEYPHFCERSDRGARDRARYVLNVNGKEVKREVDQLAKELAAHFKQVLTQSSNTIRQSLEDPASDGAVSTPSDEAVRGARDFVRAEYDNFELYDSAAFPITFNTDVDDNGPISIHRISPDDATARNDDVLQARRKLRGQELGSFGGFLDRTWRENDILWGKLDGAERLISMVLPGDDPATVELRKRLIDESHQAIVQSEANLKAAATVDWKAALRDFIDEVPSQPAPSLVAGSATRGTTVMGELLEGLSDTYASMAKPLFARAALFGRISWGIVEVSAPHTAGELFGTYWMQLLLLFAVAFLVIALIAANSALPLAVGVVAAALTLGVVREIVRRYLRGAAILTPLSLGLLTLGLVAVVTTVTVYFYNARWLELFYFIKQAAWHHQAVPERFLLEPLQCSSAAQWVYAFLGSTAALALGSFVWVDNASKAVRKWLPKVNVVRKLKSANTWKDLAEAVGILVDPVTKKIVTRAAVVRAATIVQAAGRALTIDFVFAAAYALAFIAVGTLILWRHNFATDLYMGGGILVAVLGVIAALANCRANESAIRAISMPIPEKLDTPIPEAPRNYTYAKWAAAGAGILVAVTALLG